MKHTFLFGLPFFSGTRAQLEQELLDQLKKPFSGLPLIVFTPNPEQLVLAQQRAEFRSLLRQANYVLPDGIGVVAASRLLAPVTGQSPLPQRIPGVDVVNTLIEKYTSKFLVVGGKNYPAHFSLHGQTIHTTPGYKNVHSAQPAEEKHFQKVITELQPEVVFVALGAPFQEIFTASHMSDFVKARVKLVMVVGGAFDVLLKKIPRAPRWMQQMGLEWLFRLYQEPWRWRRQLRLPQFMWLTLQELFRRVFFTRVHTQQP